MIIILKTGICTDSKQIPQLFFFKNTDKPSQKNTCKISKTRQKCAYFSTDFLQNPFIIIHQVHFKNMLNIYEIYYKSKLEILN